MENKLVEKLKWCKRELAGLKIAHETGLGLVDFYSKQIDFQFTPTWQNQYMFEIIVGFDTSLDYIPMCQSFISLGQYFDPYNIVFDETANTVKISYTSSVPNVTLDLTIKTIAASPIISLVAREFPYG